LLAAGYPRRKPPIEDVLTSTPTTVVSGQVITFTATINALAPGSGTPTGSLDFREGATDLTPGVVVVAELGESSEVGRSLTDFGYTI
jgi:hypothetical protein